jgi:hypothetical protein
MAASVLRFNLFSEYKSAACVQSSLEICPLCVATGMAALERSPLSKNKFKEPQVPFAELPGLRLMAGRSVKQDAQVLDGFSWTLHAPPSAHEGRSWFVWSFSARIRQAVVRNAHRFLES